MSLTYIVLNLLLQNELKPMKMQSDTGQFQQHHPLLLLIQMQLMKVQIAGRQALNTVREIENDTRELENIGRELESNVREIKKYLMKE